MSTVAHSAWKDGLTKGQPRSLPPGDPARMLDEHLEAFQHLLARLVAAKVLSGPSAEVQLC